MFDYKCQYLNCESFPRRSSIFCDSHINESRTERNLKIHTQYWYSNFIEKLRHILVHKFSIYKNYMNIFDTSEKPFITLFKNQEIDYEDTKISRMITLKNDIRIKNNEISSRNTYTLSTYINEQCCGITSGIFHHRNDIIENVVDHKLKRIWKLQPNFQEWDTCN